MAIATASAAAQQVDVPKPAPAHAGENGDMLTCRQGPISLAVTYNSDINANLGGGVSRGGAYLQRIGLIADADLDPLLGWRGASAHVSVHDIAGKGLSALRVDNVLTVSGIEAEPALRLFNLWVEQKLGPHTTLRFGQFTAAQEFAISSTANLFINSTFGWPASFATDLPSGGPAYPLAAPGVRLAAAAGDGMQLRVAVFAGDPAGPGTADPQRRDAHGFNGFRLKGAPFIIAEISRSTGGANPRWSIAVGGWWHADDFDDLRYDGAGQSLAVSASLPRSLAGNHVFYAVVDGRLWQAGSRSVRSFARASVSPADRNAVDLYVDTGLAITAPFSARPSDVAGLSVAFARISPRLRGLASDRAEQTELPLATPAYEMVVETSYQVHLKQALYVQPNIQLVLNPSAAVVAHPLTPSRGQASAVTVGLRTSLRL